MRDTEGVTIGRAEGTPSLDLVFDLLSNRRRRYVLYALADQSDGVATIERLTEAVIAFERTAADDDVGAEPNGGSEFDDTHDSSDDGTTVRMELQHTHLPKLENAGILEHDRRSETVRYWGQPSLEEWLEHARYKEIG
ncbi:DUF7344 domain-containing protein [Natrinema longum]|uniref:DUF7344 domain-containing protein n=1 Tax=Natrinema longum TaxID=370324 RepID=A0A8A2U7X4_9EURY|nr:hypothetical protein [Natrinema longum]MBZ6493972.1 hypothetical protein [Natrinema longum]QSW84693.1 hypothetical protein J0X27_14745 [Natrinema longum]